MENSSLIQFKTDFITLLKTSMPLPVTSIVFVCIVFLFTGIFIGGIIQKLKNRSVVKRERADAIKKSRAVLGGQFGEQIAPFLPKFPCNPGDVRFVGKPVDYVAFSGMAEGKPVRDIYFIEVKSGRSTLSEREKQIRDAVKNGRVHYVEYRIPD